MAAALATTVAISVVGVTPEGPLDCEKEWPRAESPARARSLACVRHVLSLAYGTSWTADDLDLDPPSGTAAALALSADTLTRMARHVRTLCPDGCHDVSAHPEPTRAAEWLERELEARFSVTDHSMMRSIEPLLATILAGEALDPKALTDPNGGSWSVLSVWKLRNAVFARHGRRFDNPDLHRFFYGPDGARAAGLPARPSNEPWSDARLTPIDKKNVALLKSTEDRLRAASKGR